MALGIDSAAHAGALEVGGPTLTVLASGADVPYPPSKRSLYRALVRTQAVLSEMPPGFRPFRWCFPARNRTIAGLASLTIVVEAAERSGSLITARFALEQGREVFAVPGSPLDPRCKGTNGLIRQGAILTETAADVLGALESGFRPLREEEATGPAAPPQTPSESELAKARALVLECLSPTPAAVDEIIRQSHLSPALVSWVLLELELAGRLERHPGHRASLLS
jgi:DNA processing protein